MKYENHVVILPYQLIKKKLRTMKTYKLTITGKENYTYEINSYTELTTRTSISEKYIMKYGRNSNDYVIEQIQLGNYTIEQI